jgi:hypothetical protein
MNDYAQQADPSYGQAKLGGAGSNSLGTVKPCPPPSPAVGLIDQLRLAQNETHSLIGDLESRLAFVLRSATETEGAGKSAPAPGYDTPILTELSTRIEVEANIHFRLRNLLNSLVV